MQLAVALKHVNPLLLLFIEAAHQQNQTRITLMKHSQHHKLIKTVNVLVPLSGLLLKLLFDSLFVLLDDSVKAASNNFFDNVDLYFRDDAIGFHDNIVFETSLIAKQLRLDFILQHKLLTVYLGLDRNRVYVLVLLQRPFDNNYQLLTAAIVRVLFDYHVASLIAVDLHQIQDLEYLFFIQLRQMHTLLDCPFHEVPKRNHEDLVTKDLAQGLATQNQTGYVFVHPHRHLPDCVVEQRQLTEGITSLQFCHQLVSFPH